MKDKKQLIYDLLDAADKEFLRTTRAMAVEAEGMRVRAENSLVEIKGMCALFDKLNTDFEKLKAVLRGEAEDGGDVAVYEGAMLNAKIARVRCDIDRIGAEVVEARKRWMKRGGGNEMNNDQQANETPPEPHSMEQVKEIFGSSSVDSPVCAEKETIDFIREIKWIDAELKVLHERKALLRDKIAVHMLDSAYLIDPMDGVVLVTWKTVTSTKFNQKRFKEENEELVEEYLDVVQTRQFLIK